MDDADLPGVYEASRRTRAFDPWAHRRAEPRLFILFWTCFLLATTVLAIASVGLHGVVLEPGARTAARTILLVAAIGVGVLWPMIRLSQRTPHLGAQWGVYDALGVALPLQAVIWPHIALANWPVQTAAAVAAVCGAWSVLIGGLLVCAMARGDPGPWGRSAWMIFFVLLAGAAPVTIVFLRLTGASHWEAVGWIHMMSLVTAVDQFAPARPHQTPHVTATHWTSIGATYIFAGGVWLLALRAVRGGCACDMLP